MHMSQNTTTSYRQHFREFKYENADTKRQK